MSHAFTRLHYHIAFSTKDPKAFIKPDLKDRLYAYIIGIVNNLDGVSRPSAASKTTSIYWPTARQKLLSQTF
jgi:hypothetical protein